MLIQFNTDKNVSGNMELEASLTSIIEAQLNRFSDQITRIEVHLSDEDGKKRGVNDLRCLLEARLEGMHPVAVTNDADTKVQAVRGATEKLKRALTTILGRLRNY